MTICLVSGRRVGERDLFPCLVQERLGGSGYVPVTA